MAKILKIGSRASSLALAQVQEVRQALARKRENVHFKVFTYATQGDKDKSTPLTDSVSDDFFTDTIDRALLDRKIDIAIHSAKDLPQSLREGLAIFAVTSCLDETDCFIGKSPIVRLRQGSKVGTSSLLRADALRALNPGVRCVPIRGTIQERLQKFLEGKLDGIIVATAAMKRLGLKEQITEILPWETTPLQGQLAVVGRSNDEALRELFSPLDVRRQYGSVYLIGAGPGDPELITVKAINALKKARFVFYDYLVHKDLLRYARSAEKFYVGKRKGVHSISQEALSRMLREKACSGATVARLKGGDPFLFGRGANELSYLRSYMVPVEVIPGLSSATAIPASLNIPLTARGISSSVALVSGHKAREDESVSKERLEIPKVDTIVFLMGLTKLGVIVQSLKAKGWKDTAPVAVIARGTWVDEKIVTGTLKDIMGKVDVAKLPQPALIIVGEVVRFYHPRENRKANILYTGTNPRKYRGLGHLIHWPMISIGKLTLTSAAKKHLKENWERYDIILLTSRFAVKYFLAILQELKITPKQMREKDFVVIGKDTADGLLDHDIRPAYMAEAETSEGMLRTLKKHYRLKGKNILFPRSSLPNPFLKKQLTLLGSRVEELAVYKNVAPHNRPLPRQDIRYVLFTSPSTVNNFIREYKKIPFSWSILSKGPLTSQCLKMHGYESEVLIHG